MKNRKSTREDTRDLVKGIQLSCGLRIDLLAEDNIIPICKA